jgi:hypothetical protein
VVTTTQPVLSKTQSTYTTIQFDFCGSPIQFEFNKDKLQPAPFPLSDPSIQSFYNSINNEFYQPMVNALLTYKEKYNPDDWLFYQLIRKTAQYISPKTDDYIRYTLYKWFLLTQTGYDAILAISGNRILFYVRCDEDVYNIPTRINNGKQYVCLNYHDYGEIDFKKEVFKAFDLPGNQSKKVFTYKIRHLPEFNPLDYQEKDLHFTYYDNDYHFKVKLNPQIITLFTNYPTVDYEFQLNIPLSKETYQSLIPLLRKNIRHMSTKNGVDYLMRFTRYAFLFETDSKNFGSEKRLSPEQTLFYEQSDCEDRVALFFCLVKEIYNLPMIVLAYPKHVTIAVQFDKPRGKSILYNGNKYSICEPTPQKEDLPIGHSLASLRNTPYEVVYHYSPQPGSDSFKP